MSNPPAFSSNRRAEYGVLFPHTFVGGVRIDEMTLDQARELIVGAATVGGVHLCNAYTVALASKDAAFASVLDGGSINLADGAPVAVLAALRRGAGPGRRPCGPDLMAKCLDSGRSSGTRHFLFGSTAHTVSTLRDRVEERWPGVEIVGAESPPFEALTDDELSAAIGRFAVARADVVWVGLGTPKQDFIVERLASKAPGTYVAIGAAFDFLAGTKRRAPGWMQQIGLEWLFRLCSEPRRLWRRYLVGNIQFLVAVVRRW